MKIAVACMCFILACILTVRTANAQAMYESHEPHDPRPPPPNHTPPSDSKNWLLVEPPKSISDPLGVSYDRRGIAGIAVDPELLLKLPVFREFLNKLAMDPAALKPAWGVSFYVSLTRSEGEQWPTLNLGIAGGMSWVANAYIEVGILGPDVLAISAGTQLMGTNRPEFEVNPIDQAQETFEVFARGMLDEAGAPEGYSQY